MLKSKARRGEELKRKADDESRALALNSQVEAERSKLQKVEVEASAEREALLNIQPELDSDPEPLTRTAVFQSVVRNLENSACCT